MGYCNKQACIDGNIVAPPGDGAKTVAPSPPTSVVLDLVPLSVDGEGEQEEVIGLRLDLEVQYVPRDVDIGDDEDGILPELLFDRLGQVSRRDQPLEEEVSRQPGTDHDPIQLRAVPRGKRSVHQLDECPAGGTMGYGTTCSPSRPAKGSLSSPTNMPTCPPKLTTPPS